VPGVYQAFSKAFFFPGLLLSFDLDRLLFGLAPAAFYVHQLAALALGAFLLHLLLRRWMGALWSLLGALLFLAGPPLANVAPQLGVRHYLDGFVLALAALLLFRHAVDGGGAAFDAAAALSAFLAMACKEIYVPVVLLALVLPAGTFARRLRHAFPLLAAAAAYVGWRQVMLSGYAGGYTGSTPGAGELVRLGKRLLEQAVEFRFALLPAPLDHFEHVRNFIAVVRSRKPVVENELFGNNAALSGCHMSNYSYFNKTIAVWDSASRSIKSSS